MGQNFGCVLGLLPVVVWVHSIFGMPLESTKWLIPQPFDHRDCSGSFLEHLPQQGCILRRRADRSFVSIFAIGLLG
jgi:hypothetical protein